MHTRAFWRSRWQTCFLDLNYEYQYQCPVAAVCDGGDNTLGCGDDAHDNNGALHSQS